MDDRVKMLAAERSYSPEVRVNISERVNTMSTLWEENIDEKVLVVKKRPGSTNVNTTIIAIHTTTNV
jgi:hypothetical protein